MVRVFRQKFTLEDAIGSHACSLEANTRVTNGIPLGSLLLLPVDTVNCIQTLKAARMARILRDQECGAHSFREIRGSLHTSHVTLSNHHLSILWGPLFPSDSLSNARARLIVYSLEDNHYLHCAVCFRRFEY
jgi:hypothetical protein